jgi:hypothetical protein
MRKSVSSMVVGLGTTYDVTTTGDDCMSLELETPRQKQVYTDAPWEKVQSHTSRPDKIRYNTSLRTAAEFKKSLSHV